MGAVVVASPRGAGAAAPRAVLLPPSAFATEERVGHRAASFATDAGAGTGASGEEGNGATKLPARRRRAQNNSCGFSDEVVSKMVSLVKEETAKQTRSQSELAAQIKSFVKEETAKQTRFASQLFEQNKDDRRREEEARQGFSKRPVLYTIIISYVVVKLTSDTSAEKPKTVVVNLTSGTSAEQPNTDLKGVPGGGDAGGYEAAKGVVVVKDEGAAGGVLGVKQEVGNDQAGSATGGQVGHRVGVEASNGNATA